jgi:hypothetical protein
LGRRLGTKAWPPLRKDPQGSIGTREVIEELAGLFARHGTPRTIRPDNGREFIASSLADWLSAQRVRQAFIEKGRPSRTPTSSASIVMDFPRFGGLAAVGRLADRFGYRFLEPSAGERTDDPSASPLIPGSRRSR